MRNVAIVAPIYGKKSIACAMALGLEGLLILQEWFMVKLIQPSGFHPDILNYKSHDSQSYSKSCHSSINQEGIWLKMAK